MKKKGFTLVELLAVIVILAVLAFIAVPVVLNMIEEARIGSAEDSAYSYVKGIENSIVTGYLSGNDYTAGEYNIGDIKVDVKGSTPTSGKYELDSKNEVISGKFCINGYSIDYDGKHSTHTQDDMETYNMKNINSSSPSMDEYGDYWHSKKYLGKIKKIYFVKTNEVPIGKIDTWDLSEKNNGKINTGTETKDMFLYCGTNKTTLKN